MVTGIEVTNLAESLPESSFLRTWIQWGSAYTDAPDVYHLGSGLSILGSIAPIELLLPTPRTYAPTWIMLVGASGDSRKTTVVGAARRLLQEIAPERVGHAPGSPEGLINAMAEQPAQTLFYGEFGSFLSQTTAGKYLDKIREVFTELWDCEPTGRQLAADAIILETPRLSLFAGVTPSFLGKLTTAMDWEGGFLSRWMVLAGERQRLLIEPEDNQHLWDKSRTRAQRIIERGAGPCLGLSTDAKNFWKTWLTRRDAEYRSNAPAWVRSNVARLGTVALKVAVLYELDCGEPSRHSDTWVLSPEALQFGTTVADMHLRSVFEIVSGLAESRFDRQRIAVLDVVKRAPRALNLGQILAAVPQPRMSKKEALMVMDTLIEERAVFASVSAIGGTVYSTSPPIASEIFGADEEDEEGTPTVPSSFLN